MSMTEPATGTMAWHAMSPNDVASRLTVDLDGGLDTDEVERRLEKYGPNELPTEPPPSVWVVARGQLLNPMNIMLLIVGVASFAIGQVATGLVVTGLVTFNVVMGSNQELKARASVEALAQLQVPHARVRRSASVQEVDSTKLVPGDVVLLEAGDLVPADGRLVSSATLEVQEASLTGESAPVPKATTTIEGADVALGDRTDMVFQNTQVTRGSATFIVTGTGQATQMGRIADMVTATKRSKSPLQQELDGMTKVFGIVAWSAVAVIAIVGFARGQDIETLLLLCVSTGIASIPTGLPTFVQTMLSSGARRLAASKAVVKTLTDVETLGGTTVINSDKTGTLTMNAMTATTMLAGGDWFKIEGGGYKKSGAILGSGGWRAARLPATRPRPLSLHRRHRGRRRVDHRRSHGGGARGPGRQDGSGRGADASGASSLRGGPVRFGVQVHGDLPRPSRAPCRGDRPGAALRERQGRSRRRDRALRSSALARKGDTDRKRSGRDSWPRTSSSPSVGCGCSHSLHATWTTPRWRPRSAIPWLR